MTCLAKGMRVGDLPIITREKLDSVAAHVEKLRENLEKARSFVGPNCESGRLLRWIYSTGASMSREQFESIAAFQPMMEGELVRLYFQAAHYLIEGRRQALRITRAKPAYRRVLESYWKTLWAVGHLACLASMGNARELIASLPEGPTGESLAGVWSWGATRQGVLAIAVRGLWGTAKLGKLSLGPYKRAFPEAHTTALTVDRVLGLAGIGLRHRKLRAEVHKALDARPTEDDDELTMEYRRALANFGGALRHATMEETDVMLGLHLRMGRELCVAMSSVAELPVPIERPEDVPEDIARAALVNTMVPTLQLDSEAAMILPMVLPWVVRSEPSALYLPREWLALSPPWEPSDTLLALGTLRDYNGTDAPVQAPPRPGRNAPCPCGSGKKYKRCCGG